MRSYFDAMLRYFEFSGRTTRAQYWLFQLVCVIMTCAALYADYHFSGVIPGKHSYGFFMTFVMLIHIVPNITITVRRLHDIGKSGWWFFIGFVPVIGLILCIWMFFGSVDDDGYGPREDDNRPAKSRPLAPVAAGGGGMAWPKARGTSLADIQSRRGGSRLI